MYVDEVDLFRPGWRVTKFIRFSKTIKPVSDVF